MPRYFTPSATYLPGCVAQRQMNMQKGIVHAGFRLISSK